MKQWKVQAVILGGAGLAGVAAQVQGLVNVPVIDSVLAGARQTLLAAQAAQAAPKPGAQTTNGFGAQWSGLSEDMLSKVGAVESSAPIQTLLI